MSVPRTVDYLRMGNMKTWGGREKMENKIGTHSSVGALEHVQLLLRGGVLVGRDDSLEGIFGDVPQLVVLALDQQDGAGALAVEGGGGVQDGLADDLLDLLVGDGRLLLKRVVGAAGLDGGEVVGRHGAG